MTPCVRSTSPIKLNHGFRSLVNTDSLWQNCAHIGSSMPLSDRWILNILENKVIGSCRASRSISVYGTFSDSHHSLGIPSRQAKLNKNMRKFDGAAECGGLGPSWCGFGGSHPGWRELVKPSVSTGRLKIGAPLEYSRQTAARVRNHSEDRYSDSP